MHALIVFDLFTIYFADVALLGRYGVSACGIFNNNSARIAGNASLTLGFYLEIFTLGTCMK